MHVIEDNVWYPVPPILTRQPFRCGRQKERQNLRAAGPVAWPDKLNSSFFLTCKGGAQSIHKGFNRIPTMSLLNDRKCSILSRAVFDRATPLVPALGTGFGDGACLAQVVPSYQILCFLSPEVCRANDIV